MLNRRRAAAIVLSLLTSAIVFEAVLCITIDNQLQVIRNDCYERLAIGQRVDKMDVYRETDSNTVKDCQMECTHDEEKCRSFSFGIGVKGNASCELSSHIVKETVDLKPMGTTDDTDFDLYIKKLGCKLVIDMEPDLPDFTAFVNDEQYVPEEADKPKPHRPRPGSYKKNHGGFHYGSEQHQSSHNSESHWSMKKLYKGNRPTNDDDRAVSYNKYEKPNTGSYDKPNTGSYDKPNTGSYDKPNIGSYDKPNTGFYDKPNKYEYGDQNSDKFSFTNPYDDMDGATYYKPQNHYGSEKDQPKPPSSGYGTNGNKQPSSGYGSGGTSSSSSSSSGYESFNSPHKPSYDSNPKPPFRPSHLNNPYSDQPNNLYQKPNRPSYHDPDNPNYESQKPSGHPQQEDSGGYGRPQYHDPDKPSYGSHKPLAPSHAEDLGGYGFEKPHNQPPKFDNSGGYEYTKPPTSSGYNYDKPTEFDGVGGYDYPRPGRPSYGSGVKPVFEMNTDLYEYPKRPNFPGGLYGAGRPSKPGSHGSSYGGSRYNIMPEIYSPKYPYQNPIIKDNVDPYGHLITSIITEIGDVCFRRALAGKRVTRIFVRKAVSCERVEHCQQECAEEKRFICEGFNYRLDPSGHGRGDCELLDVPHIRLDVRRDIIPDADYDYYEKDRNCKEHQDAPPYRPSGGDRLPGPPSRPPLHDWHSSSYNDHYDSRDRFRDRYDSFDRRGSEYDRPPLARPYNRRNDYFEESYSSRDKYEDRYNSYDYSYHYPVPNIPFGKDYDYKSYETHLPPRNGYDHTDYWIKDKNYGKPYYDNAVDQPPYNNKWGVYGGSYGDFGSGHVGYEYTNKNNDFKGTKYDIATPSPPKHWGEYGGTYGAGGGSGGYYSNHQTNNYWGSNKANEYHFTSNPNNYHGPQTDYKHNHDYLPPTYPPSADYPPSYGAHDTGYHYDKPSFGDLGHSKEPSLGVVNECSLRSAAGYRLYKSIVKKILTVPTIYDCEYGCYTEKDFVCTSYAYRYVSGADIPPNNCYLSNKNYKELDYYTDLEQDRSFDIYTMNSKDKCSGGSSHLRDSSECFLHVRSGQRLDDSCIKATFLVKSIADCEMLCVRVASFICRTFSFRYGSAIIGETADNCQLSDVPYHELDPKKDFLIDPGFIVYERASFRYGCELNQLPNLHKPKPSTVSVNDEICYVGFGWPANLSPQAIKKVLRVSTESECKIECTRARMETPFCCMTFSYKSESVNDEPNCFLSEIFQRDLLENIDYIRSSDHWLFSWDNTNPQCNSPVYYDQGLPFDEKYDVFTGSLTWRIYSVGGWPCKRGSVCKQSELGFWFCELEGGSPSAWDYCCRPKHQCGYSQGFPYQWCYVGPSSTQWRKCNDKYYPYLPSPRPPEHYIPNKIPKPTFIPHIPSKPAPSDYDSKPPSYVPTTFVPPPTIHIEPPKKTYLPPSINKPRPWITTGKPIQPGLQPPYRPGFRPDRPQAPPQQYKPAPTLDEFEQQFDNFFLDPPKPGGFGQARHWPVSYLHKEQPPNATAPFERKFERIEMERDISVKPRVEAIKNLIEVIKGNDLNNIKYQISNASDRNDDVLHVQIPLPSKFSETRDQENENYQLISEPIDLLPRKPNSTNITNMESGYNNFNLNTASTNIKERRNNHRSIYRRGLIEKANVTNSAQSLKIM